MLEKTPEQPEQRRTGGDPSVAALTAEPQTPRSGHAASPGPYFFSHVPKRGESMRLVTTAENVKACGHQRCLCAPAFDDAWLEPPLGHRLVPCLVLFETLNQYHCGAVAVGADMDLVYQSVDQLPWLDRLGFVLVCILAVW